MINSQTPSNSDAFFEQYSEEQVRHAFDMVADENGQLPEELADYQQAYDEMTVDPDAMSRYREVLNFREALFRATPRIFITRLILAANVAVFLAMALRGVDVMSPTIDHLTAWGANVGWLTLDGQSWRLFTCMFLHIGLIHIALNMYVLWQVGNLLERLAGNAGFLVLYVGSGLVASLASLYWNESVVSAGASGAVFGAFGGLVAFIWRSDDCSMEVFGPLLTGISKFILLNIGFGIVVNLIPHGPNIDMAAHLGGLISGGLLGLLLARPIMTSTKQDIFLRNGLALGVSAGLLLAGLYWAPAAPLNPFDVTKQGIQLEKDVNVLAKKQRQLEMKHGNIISQLIDQKKPIVAEVAKLTAGLREDILPKWQEYEKKADTIRTIWPSTFEIKPLDELIKFIKQQRSATEERVNALTTPPLEATTLFLCPTRPSLSGFCPLISTI